MLMRPETSIPTADDSAVRRLLRSFKYAAQGIAYLFRTQRNARIHLAVGISVILAGLWLHIRSTVQWSVLILTIAAVLILEGLNTAIEAAIDRFSSESHPLAKVSKDLAAGMVLIGALAATIVGFLILGPPLWHRFFD